MDLGWILDGSWVDLGWILDGSWVDLGWILGGSWMDLRWISGESWMDLSQVISAASHMPPTYLPLKVLHMINKQNLVRGIELMSYIYI